jgi:hypothetical protein
MKRVLSLTLRSGLLPFPTPNSQGDLKQKASLKKISKALGFITKYGEE